MSTTVVRSSAAHLRLARAREWLVARQPAEEVLVIAATSDAANDLLRAVAMERGAAFGWHRATLGRVAAALCERALVDEGLTPIGALACEAVVARAVHTQREAGALGRFAPIADGPGFARAVARSLAELRLGLVGAAALEAVSPEVQTLLQGYEGELASARLADRAIILERAYRVADDASIANPLLGLPTLLLDVSAEHESDRRLLEAIAARAPEVFATLPAGDASPLPGSVEDIEPPDENGASSLGRLQAHLFQDVAPPEAPLGDDVTVLSAPGESRECVEIARIIQRLAAEGHRFDQMAILLRGPDEYRPHLEEALFRASIPAHFARGAVRPDPAGRAFLALLACAAEGLSARGFAEYLSLGEVPDATAMGEPPAPLAGGDRWVAPDEELVPEVVATALGEASQPEEAETPAGPGSDPETSSVTDGTLRAPRHWEQLLVDAAVIGGRDRWQRRLDGLERELELELEELEEDDPRSQHNQRSLRDVIALRGYALPLLDALDALPRQASWGSWLDALGALATRALRRPDRVLAALAELAPMAAVGPVELDEVQLVLSRRLLEVSVPAANKRYGRVFIAPVAAARGLSFEIVFVPGLAERLFPQKIREDPILLDESRQKLESPGLPLTTNPDRIRDERRALRLAVGAARVRVVFSYPRLDLDQARPRVPSFYALEALRAAEGRLPGFAELARRAETLSDARVGWPAPAQPDDAIDEAEHDLALLDSLLELEEEKSVGTARYLMTSNPHLGRALRFRARRWLKGWTVADGLVNPSDKAREAIRAHALEARSFSPTALQNYATCPYKFFLSAIHRLAPREVPEAIEELNPLQRGSLVHDVQFQLFELLRDQSLLPVDAANLDRVLAVLDDVLDRVAEQHRDELAPAIARVWDDGVHAVRADLREWLRREVADASGFVPWRFEYSFGLPGRRDHDPNSTPDPVPLDCGIRLRGSIDLIERNAEGDLRVTDHKTGRVRVNKSAIVAGGESLQAVLYALVAERVFPEASVGSGRLYYCTATGGFEDRSVALDQQARDSAQQVADTIGAALREPFLPAAPADGACRWCDYQVVCGPYEQLRTARKWEQPLEPLTALRELP